MFDKMTLTAIYVACGNLKSDCKIVINHNGERKEYSDYKKLDYETACHSIVEHFQITGDMLLEVWLI